MTKNEVLQDRGAFQIRRLTSYYPFSVAGGERNPPPLTMSKTILNYPNKISQCAFDSSVVFQSPGKRGGGLLMDHPVYV